MESLNHFTNTLNNFVRFFESINCLFWQLRWLEENITRSNRKSLLLVGGIITFCIVFVYFDGSNGDLGEIWNELLNGLPIAIVFGVIAYYLLKRFMLSRDRHDDRDAPYDPVNYSDDSEHQGVEVTPIKIVNAQHVV